MNLLLLDQFSDPGGAQQGLLDLLPGIRERGWNAVVALPGAGELFERVRALGFAAERISYGSIAPIKRLAAHADLVYINGPRLLPAAACAGLRAPVLFHSHSYLRGVKRTVAGVALRRLHAAVLANCRFVADVWKPYVRRPAVVYNGVAGPSWDRRSFPTACRAAPTVGCIGRIAPEKGQLEFLHAARAIHAALPRARFLIYGAPLFSGEAYALQVRAAAQGLPVEFPGWVSDVYAALATLDLLLVPSAWYEATTRVIPEAFAAGVPVVAFRSGGIPEIVQDGRTGCLAGDAAEMARAALGLLRDDARRAAVAATARESWERDFTIERYREQVLEVIEAAVRA